MKLIPLTRGKSVKVDDWNYDWLNKWKWFLLGKPGSYYAARCLYLGGGRKNSKRETILMHRLIMNTPPGLEVDHIDINGLNCQEHNMRNCTHKNNSTNKKAWGRSLYKGVSINKEGEIRAQLTVNNKVIYLGACGTELQAAKRYDAMARYFYKEFANLNFK